MWDSRLTRPVNIFILLQRLTLLFMKFYTYILLSLKDIGLYIGFTSDLKRRLIQHANGQVDSTRNRLPVKLIHYEYFINENDARARESYLKSGYGRQQLKQFLKNTFNTN